MALGMSYSPLTDDETKNKPPEQEGMVQQAIKLLSLRMPTVQGAQALSAPSLLQPSAGGGGLSPEALRRLLQMLSSRGMGGGGFARGMPGESQGAPGLPPSGPTPPPVFDVPAQNTAPPPSRGGEIRPPTMPPGSTEPLPWGYGRRRGA